MPARGISKQSSLFSFYELASGGKPKGALVHCSSLRLVGTGLNLQSSFVLLIKHRYHAYISQ